MRLNIKNRRGDTLIEVVFALAILATILTVVTSGAITAWRTSRAAGERAQASALANEQAEALRAYRNGIDWASLSPVLGDGEFYMKLSTPDGLGEWVPATGVLDASDSPLPQAQVRILPKLPALDASMKSFTVKVDWKSLGGNTINSTTQDIVITENK